jgi:hypothetical protein
LRKALVGALQLYGAYRNKKEEEKLYQEENETYKKKLD